MWFCPCWPRKRPKPVISGPDITKLRPITLQPGPPRPAPAPPGTELLPRDILQLGDNNRDELMAWLEERMRSEQTVVHPALRRPESMSPLERISSGQAYTPNGSPRGIIVHLGTDASCLSGESNYSQSSSSGSSRSSVFYA